MMRMIADRPLAGAYRGIKWTAKISRRGQSWGVEFSAPSLAMDAGLESASEHEAQIVGLNLLRTFCELVDHRLRDMSQVLSQAGEPKPAPDAEVE